MSIIDSNTKLRYFNENRVAEKNIIENSLKNRRIIFVVIFLFFLVGFLFSGLRIQKEKQIYKERFEKIIAQQNTAGVEEQPLINHSNNNQHIQKFVYVFYNKTPGLKPLFAENILTQLEHFENENKFLDSQISQKSLSEDLSTNSTYFLKIINTYKRKNFALYISDLRLDYIINHLKNR